MAISEQLTDMGFGKHSLGEEQEVEMVRMGLMPKIPL